MTDSTLSHTRHTDGKGGAAAAMAAAVRGRSSDCLGGSLLRAGARRLRRVARQARGQGASVILVAAQGNAEVASGGGDASVSYAAKRPVTARWVTGLETDARKRCRCWTPA